MNAPPRLLRQITFLATLLRGGPAIAEPSPSAAPDPGTEEPPAATEPLVPPSVADPAPSAPPSPAAPFAWGDFTWMNGQSRQRDFPLSAFGNAVTLSLYLDFNYAYSANHPRDNTLTGTASVPRHNEIVVNLASIGFDWDYKNVIGRLAVQYGTMLNVVQDLDGTATRGRSLSVANLRYIREAVAGYHFDGIGRGLNLEGGIFMSYIGLESYLLAENWNYSRSIISENTPFYFQGVRAQYYPNDRVKVEPWLMNGWQSYGKYNYAPSAGVALRWSPIESFSAIANFYGGTDTKGISDRVRFHHDDSFLVRYFHDPKAAFISKGAISLNTHFGFESGGENQPGPAHAHVVGSSLVHRTWFSHDHLAFAVRGEAYSNPSRYLSQFPPPGFATGPGVKALQLWGITGTFDVLPNDFFALRIEGSYRRANAPYFAGPAGTTSPDGFQPTPIGYLPDVVNDQLIGIIAVNIRL